MIFGNVVTALTVLIVGLAIVDHRDAADHATARQQLHRALALEILGVETMHLR